MTQPPPFPELTTARMRLREITHEDADEMFAIHGDLDLMKWFGSDPLADRDAAVALIDRLGAQRLLPDPGVRWGLQRRDHDELIGSCGLMGWQRRNRSCSIGYELAREHQGEGLMHEALTAAIGWGWEHMDLVRIEAQIHPDNQASLQVVEKLGFEREGLLRKYLFWGGTHHDMLVCSLIR